MTDLATNFLARETMIWRAMTAARGVKNVRAYLAKQARKHGEIIHEAFRLATGVCGTDTLAGEQERIDQLLSEARGWKTCRELRSPGSFERLNQ